MSKISEIVHPTYDASLEKWELYRFTAGDALDFLDNYLEKRPKETSADFELRKKITYVPMFAKSALQQIQNSIKQRLSSVRRVGGSENYQLAAEAKLGGIDRKSSSLNKFMGLVLNELTTMGEVGIYVDAPASKVETRAEEVEHIPYAYIYPAENIRAWQTDPSTQGRYKKLLLRDIVESVDPTFGLATGLENKFRLYEALDSGAGVKVTFYDKDGRELTSTVLDIPEIPFIHLRLTTSLLSDVAKHQVALLNLASADMKYAWQGNTVFLAEQYNDTSPEEYFSYDTVEEQDPEVVRTSKTRHVGVDTGVRVPKGVDYPKYVSPDDAPLRVSMDKEEQIKAEINELIGQTLKNLSGSSAESKRVNEKKEDDGLKAIGEELQYAEVRLAQLFSMYEGDTSAAEINYPDNFQFVSEADKRAEASELGKLMSLTPSVTGQKAIAKKLIRTLVAEEITDEDLKKAYLEIDNAPGAVADPEALFRYVDANIISPGTAAVQAGFGEEEAQKAEEAVERRAIAIARAQAQNGSGARGVNDLAPDPGAGARAEKQASRLAGQRTRKT